MDDIFFYNKVLQFQCRQCGEMIPLNELNGILEDEKSSLLYSCKSESR